MKNVVIYYLNGAGVLDPAVLLNSGYQATAFFDRTVTENHQQQTIDFENDDALKNAAAGITPLDHIILIPNVFSSPGNQITLLQKILAHTTRILKSLSLCLMLQRTGKIWLLESLKQHQLNTEEAVLAESCLSGLKHLINIFAMEMAKKSINANTVYTKNCTAGSEFADILKWSELYHPFYLTAQELRIE